MPEIALHAEDAGISALFIHGKGKKRVTAALRTTRFIKKVKDALKIPVASG